MWFELLRLLYDVYFISQIHVSWKGQISNLFALLNGLEK